MLDPRPGFLTLLLEPPGTLLPLWAAWGLADTTCVAPKIVSRPQGAQEEFCNSLGADQTLPRAALAPQGRNVSLHSRPDRPATYRGRPWPWGSPRRTGHLTHQDRSPLQRKLKWKPHYTQKYVTIANPSHLDHKSSLIVSPKQAKKNPKQKPVGNFLTLDTQFFLAVSGTKDPG